ncbi:MAG: ribose-5-phosphate isomerase RpiA [Rhodothermales bacterium]
MPNTDSAKLAAGKHAAALVENGMHVGLGTGSTTAFALEELGRRIREEGLSVVGTPTSSASERMARRVGIPLVSLDEVDRLDIALDGADEVDPDLNLIKGRGAAHTREKIVASLADRFVVLADESKLVERLGVRAPVPVEVLPMAAHPVERALARLGGAAVLRMGQRKDGPVVTDQGFWILDVTFEGIDDPDGLNAAIKQLPGVLDHGLFVHLASDVIVGQENGTYRVISTDDST